MEVHSLITSIAPQGQQHVVARIREGLEQTTVRSGIFVDASAFSLFDAVDRALPTAARDELTNYIGEKPAANFIYDRLSTKLGRALRYQADSASVPLTSLDEFKDSDALAKEIFEHLISLPWKYKLIAPLPEAIGETLLATLGETAFSSDVSLIKMDNSLAPMPTSTGLAALMSPPPASKEQAALEIKVTGFMGFPQTVAAENALNLIDSFLGMCLASGIFHYGFVHFHRTPERPVYVHKEILGGPMYESSFDLSRVQAEGMVSLRMTASIREQKLEVQTYLIGKLSDSLRQLFSESTDAARLRTAAKWLFNSHAATDPMLSFVQATIVLEILLGEEKSNDKVGVSALLRDRCAYLIGSSPDDRRKLKKEFDAIYEIRSNIVHTGKHKLSMHEDRYLHTARSLGARIINKELDLLGTPK